MMPSPRLATALFDGDRLRQARLFCGWRKVEVARALGLTPAVVSQYEQGRTRPSAATLAALSLHLGFPPEFFERGRPAVRIDQGQAHFRRLRSTSKLERDRLVVRLELMAELLGRIEEHVRLPAVSIPTVVVDPDEGDQAAEAAAGEVRRAWDLNSGPIDDVVRLLEAKGVVLVRPRFGTGEVDAFSTWAGGRPLIVLASDKGDAARSRFDAAHELGHLVMHHDAEPGRQAVERQAQRFAAAFLMPAQAISREFPPRMSWPAYLELKQRWRVSLQALLYRARGLGVLSPDAYQRAQVQLSARWGRAQEPGELGPPEQPMVIQRALDLLSSQLGIDAASLADQERLPPDTLASLLADVSQMTRSSR
ncbi:MAG: XRE family transcriptional regulator [Candidatus Nephthysia bennettiae]|nr:MAG: XRE family transcriptional regulator [Candidatus Dormibacteraeota bacterium]